jgi:serine protease Do
MTSRIAASFLSVLVFVHPALLQSQAARSTPPSLAQFSDSIEELARSTTPAVVQIKVRGRAPVEEGGAERAGFVAEQRATGSGVIVDPAGYIVTNAHVVAEARQIEVSILQTAPGPDGADHTKIAATLVGLDHETDLAVLKIDMKGLPTLSFLDSAALKQGQLVMAIGSPLGLNNSITVGVISAPVRYLDPEKPMFYIQTDAPINPGNSGGALVDIQGHLVGINTLIISKSGGSEGIGFAIPANIVKRVYEGLRKDGAIRRGAIGIIPQDITGPLASGLGLDRDYGVILSDIVPHGAAEAAGLKPGDIVLAADGKPVRESRQLVAALFQHRTGEEIALDIQRKKEKFTVQVAVVPRPKTPGDLVDLASREAHLIRRLGVLALTLDERVTPILPDLRRLYGVTVAAIALEYAAVNPGLIAGDVIYEMNGVPMHTLEDLRVALDGKKKGAPIALLIERGGQLQYVAFELE